MTKVKPKKEEVEFTEVDLEEFYDRDELAQQTDGFSTDLIVLTDTERELVNEIYDRLKTISPETLVVLADRIADLERLTANIDHFPSLLQQQFLDTELRTPHTLIESLLTEREGDKILHLPSKAILGKGFLVAKFHVFCSMAKLASDSHFEENLVTRIRSSSLAIMFTIMAEDVYLSLIDHISISIDIRQKVASELLILWEHRADKNVADMAPVLEAVWNARRKLAPAFGTMVGTSELLLLSIEMDDEWCNFISTKLGDSNVSMAMEEFLFGISYEEIQQVKQQLREKGLHAVSRDEVAGLLGKKSESFTPLAKDEFDPKGFYQLYSIRRDNARSRQRLRLPGPHYTLEDHYMRFILEKQKERHFNDI